ncbi:acyl carrier protein [Gracilimonas tropica]|uniref:acyl carrier protein n=1 Tax=Gracilimonas tropica TaxID=454600 RepID=UPI000368623C|nr:phosphopantetheine-binding protein [Gracilimonas tropica]
MTLIIIELIKNTLLIEDIRPDDDLIEAGYLDSLSIIHLIVNLEQTFGITLAPETLDLDEFRTPKNIQKLVESHIQNTE